MNTKERIIETALELFNNKGTKLVSTNHIAEEMGISPGNLYYHFRNKEEIIHAIFDQMDIVGMQEYSEVIKKYPAGSMLAMEETFMMIQRFNWRYRFFKRELTSLLLNDKILHDRYAQIHTGMLQLIRHSINSSIEQDLLIPMPDVELALFVEEVWLLMLFWLNYLEAAQEEVNEQTLIRGSSLVRNAIKCRLTEKGRSLLDEIK